jgi:membrane-bound lytic murein transglycosylase B
MAILALATLVGCGGASEPGDDAPTATPTATATATPRPSPAQELTALHEELYAAIDAWKDRGDGPPPAAVTEPARRQQQVLRRLVRHPRQAAAAIAHMRGPAKRDARDIIAAQTALRTLNAPFKKAHLELKIGEPEPAGRLHAYYREARGKSGVGVPLLAAVNLVESAFGRLQNDSVAGAQGPMQFMPATWRTYGRGGDVHDPHDAILGAARFLHAAGAPANERGALYRYNPSPLYVKAVMGYAKVIRRDPRGLFALYAWPAPVP